MDSLNPNADADAPEMVGLASFEKIARAREAALNLAALGLAYVIEREGSVWVLKVEASALEQARRELSEVAREERELEEAGRLDREGGVEGEESMGWAERLGPLSGVAMGFVGFGVLQAEGGAEWMEAGILKPEEVWRGQVWRVVTALTLHGDLMHWVANLGWGLVFGGLLMPRFGSARTWGLILASGICGNALNAAVYAAGGHRSLGASTAVFGALGLMTGARLREVLQGRRRRVWDWVLPPGAGLCLLGTLGTGGAEGAQRVDVLAHLFGFLAGSVLGFLWMQMRGGPGGARASVGRFEAQWAMGSLLVLAGAWGVARLRWGG